MSLALQKISSAASNSRSNGEIEALFARASGYHQSGQLAQARIAYKKVLRKLPRHFNALHMLGLCEYQGGNSPSAAALLRQALLVNPLSTATGCLLGMVLVTLQQPDEALACFDNVIALDADFDSAHFGRGNVLAELGRTAEAIASFDKAIAIDPRHASALTSKGHLLNELGEHADAIVHFSMALAVEPANVTALVNRGVAHKNLCQEDRAIADFDMALAIDPDRSDVWLNRSAVLFASHRLGEALAAMDRALLIVPNFAVGWIGRAQILMRMGKLTEAIASCERAVAIEPGLALALTQLGQCHGIRGDADVALGYFDRVLAMQPNDELALSNKIFTMDFLPGADPAQQQTARSEWWRQVGSKIARQPPQPDKDYDPARRIVLGYVSGDFRQHSAAFAFRPVLEQHDKTRFEVICYSTSLIDDAVTKSLRLAADRWRNVSTWSDDQLAQGIQADQVDILIDLSGHTSANRLRTFAGKPAPIQVTAWGHATGTGLPTIDYLFSDPVVILAQERSLYAEQIYDLPCLCIVEPPPAGLRSSQPPVNANGYVTYGVFNRTSKITNEAAGVWARILGAAPTSRLLIKDREIDDPAIRAMLLERFALHGIGAERIRLMGSTSREQHLAAFSQVDIALDPFPQGGGVSTWEAVHMGVPVVSKLGGSLSSRLAGSIMSAIGLSAWVAADDDQYVDIALRATPDKLGMVRRELPDLIDRSCSPASYTRAVEQAYQMMWEKCCNERRQG